MGRSGVTLYLLTFSNFLENVNVKLPLKETLYSLIIQLVDAERSLTKEKVTALQVNLSLILEYSFYLN